MASSIKYELFWRMNVSLLSHRAIFKRGISSIVIKVIGALLAFSMNVIVARTVSIDAAGYFFLSVTLVALISTVSRYGFDSVLVKNVAAAENAEQQNTIFTISLMVSISLCIALSVLFYFSTHIISGLLKISDDFLGLVGIIALAIPFFTINFMASLFYQGKKNNDVAMFLQNVVIPLLFLLPVLIFVPTTTLTLMWVYLLACLLSFFIALLYSYKYLQLPVFSNTKNLKKVTHGCSELLIVQLLIIFGACFGQIMLSLWHSAESVAVYTIAQKITFFCGFFVYAFNSVMAPLFAEAFRDNDINRVMRDGQWITRILMVISIPLIFFVAFFAPEILQIFGEEYKKGAYALRIFCLAQIVNVMTAPVNTILQMLGYESALRKNFVISAGLCILVGIILIPTFGVNGAAFTSALYMVLVHILSMYKVRSLFGFYTFGLSRN